MVYNIQKRNSKDKRRWEEIEIEEIELIKDIELPDFIEMMFNYLIIFNRIEENQSKIIEEIRVSKQDSFQGYYVTDWEKVNLNGKI